MDVRRVASIVVWAALAGSLHSSAQHREQQQKTLPDYAADFTVTPISARGAVKLLAVAEAPLENGIVCDEHQNLYIRVMDLSLGGNAVNSPVLRISSDGSSIQRFDLNAVPSLRGKTYVAPEYGVDRAGKVYYFVQLPSESRDVETLRKVIAFAPNGEYANEVDISAEAWPDHFTPLTNGWFLVVGSARPRTAIPPSVAQKSSLSAGGIKEPEALLAVLDASGKLVRNLQRGADSTGPGTPSADGPYTDAIEGPDQQIYVLQGSGVITAYNLSGVLRAQFKLQMPAEARANSIHSAPNLLFIAIQIPIKQQLDKSVQRRWRVLYAVLNSHTGNVVKWLEPTEGTRGGLVCVTERELTFLTVRDSKLGLVQADWQ